MLNQILSHVKSRLGASARQLELSDEELVRCLQDETLQTFSVYAPFYIEYSIDLEKSVVEGMTNTYNLPLEIHGFKVVGVEKMIPSSGMAIMNSGGAGNWGILGGNYEAAMNSFINAKLATGMNSLFMTPETFQYIHPGLLRVYKSMPSTASSLMLFLKTTHRKDFGTIPNGYLEMVKKLALADVANDLLGIRSYFSNINTTFAEINLNLDQLKDWSDKRDDIIENLRKSQLKASGATKIWLA